MGDIAVKYVSRDVHKRGTLRIDTDGVGLLFGKHSGSYSWDRVQSIAFDDPGRSKASGGAIVAFGVLGLAARKSFSIITVTADQTPHYFESDSPIGTWRSLAPRMLAEVPEIANRIVVDGVVVGAQPAISGPPPGWYSDPEGTGRTRWWDGTRWTEHYQ